MVLLLDFPVASVNRSGGKKPTATTSITILTESTSRSVIIVSSFGPYRIVNVQQNVTTNITMANKYGRKCAEPMEQRLSQIKGASKEAA